MIYYLFKRFSIFYIIGVNPPQPTKLQTAFLTKKLSNQSNTDPSFLNFNEKTNTHTHTKGIQKKNILKIYTDKRKKKQNNTPHNKRLASYLKRVNRCKRGFDIN